MHIFIKKKNPTWQGSSDKVFNRDSANSIALVSLSISVHKNNKNIYPVIKKEDQNSNKHLKDICNIHVHDAL